MRFAISLKQSADPDGEQEWQLKHFSSVKFARGPSLDTRVSVVRESIEMDLVDAPSDQLQACRLRVTQQDN